MSQAPTSTTEILQNSATPAEEDTSLDMKQLADLQKMQQGQALLKWADEQYTKLKGARHAQEEQWYKNIAAYSKNNRVVINKNPDGSPVARKNHGRKEGDVWINRIRPYVRTEIAKFTSNQPTASVVPMTMEDEDMYIAQAAEQVWTNQYKEGGVRKTFLSTAWWLSMTGNGFIKTWWDKNIADPRVVQYDGIEPETGNIVYGNVTPFNIWVPDLLEEELENQPYIINAYTKPVEWVQMFYGELLKASGITEVKPDAIGSSEIISEQRLGLRNAGEESQKDSILIKEFWVKPGATKLLPGGGMFTVINGKLVQATLDKMPYPHGQYPIAKFDNIPTGGFYSASGIEDLEPINREYNHLRQTIRRIGALNSNPQFVFTEGSLDPRRVTNRPGQWIPVRPGMAFPYPLPKSDIPASVFNSMQSVLMDFEDVSGQHQVSKGSAPPGVTAATAINYLQEKDDSYSSTAYSSIENGMEKVAKQTLHLASAYWTQERMITVLGEDNGVMDSIIVSGQELAKGHNIRIDGGSALPQSPAAKRAYLLELLQMGVIDQAQFLEFSDLGGMQAISQTIKRDENHARRENIKFRALTEEYIMQFQEVYKEQVMQAMAEDPEEFIAQQMEANGMDAESYAELSEEEQDEFMQNMAPPEIPLPIPVNTWDNHEVHIEIHNNFRKTQAFELLPEAVKEVLDEHVMKHEQMMQEDMFGNFMDMMGGEMNPESPADMGGGQLPPDLMELNQAGAAEMMGPGDDETSLQQSNG